MKRELRSIAAASVIVVLASCAGPRPAPVAPAAPEAAVPPSLAALEGTWREIRNNTQAVTGKTWTFTGNRVAIRDGELSYTGTFAADPSRDPQEIDFTFEGYPVNQGICLLTGDLLTLKVRDSAAERAKKFGMEPGYTLILCERAKGDPVP